jgi:hypothetical protein
MAKRKAYLPDKYSSAGYSDWPIRRTISEAVNVARWNPWLAHAWMEEARNQISLDNPFYQEFDDAAAKINAYWRSLPKYRWFNEDAFWERDGMSYHPTYIQLISE